MGYTINIDVQKRLSCVGSTEDQVVENHLENFPNIVYQLFLTLIHISCGPGWPFILLEPTFNFHLPFSCH